MRSEMTEGWTVAANGAAIPVLGFGTWQFRGREAMTAVNAALDVGYRHIDTAAMYANEAEVGEAIRAHPAGREAVFVTTKVWHTDLRERDFFRSAETSLGRLGMDQVDLLLIHWPDLSIPVAEQVRTLCKAKRAGLARHVGVSNFSAGMLEDAVAVADEPLVTNQVEHHPLIDQTRLFETCRRHGLAVTSYLPLGRGRVFDHPVVADIARETGRTPAQVVLRWQVQISDNLAIPRSSNPERIRENFAIFDFALTDDQFRRLSALAGPEGRMVDPSWAPDWDAA